MLGFSLFIEHEALIQRATKRRKSLPMYRSSHQRCSVKKGVLRNFTKFTEKDLRQRLFFNIKKETLAQVFSCGFCEIPKNTFFTEHLWTTASECIWNNYIIFAHKYNSTTLSMWVVTKLNCVSRFDFLPLLMSCNKLKQPYWKKNLFFYSTVS